MSVIVTNERHKLISSDILFVTESQVVQFKIIQKRKKEKKVIVFQILYCFKNRSRM